MMTKMMKNNLLVLVVLVGLSQLLMACSGDDYQHFDDYDPDDQNGDTTSVEEKPKYLWIDASANFKRFSHKDSIDHYLDKAKDAGFNKIVVDVRPIAGDVLYNSSIVKELTSWQGYTRDNSWDYLQTFIDKGHQRDLQVYASMNVFVGGHNSYDKGVVYRDSEMGGYTTILNRPEGMVDITNVSDKYGMFFNPAREEVQRYCLSLIEEVVKNYPIDGLILDRVRFDGLNSDFSQYSRSKFEAYIQQDISNYPGDIFSWTRQDGEPQRNYGDLYPKWLEWRAKVVYDFFEQARTAVKDIDSDVDFGTYTGAWYPTYYEVGANWASQNYNPQNGDYTNWMFTDSYKDYGYAGLLDVYMAGVYFSDVYGSGWYTVEGGLNNAQQVTKGDVPVTSSLYVDVYDEAPADMTQAVELSLKEAHGLMVFDIVHLIKYNYWEEVKTGIDNATEQESQ